MLIDYLGFHIELTQDAAPDTIVHTYMNIHETLLLFAGIRYFWESNRKLLADCLFVKDGPLQLRAHYTKLAASIRNFLAHARDEGCPVNIIGQEKTGQFADNLELIGRDAPARSMFIPGDHYIREYIQHRPDRGYLYGMYSNYGAKLFVKVDDYHQMALNIPIGEYKPNPAPLDLIGAERIFATIPKILSNRHEGALVPVELAHGVASLSTYPSAHILKIFSETALRG